MIHVIDLWYNDLKVTYDSVGSIMGSVAPIAEITIYYILTLFSLLHPFVFQGRSLPLANVHCTTCNAKCKPMETLHESHCIAVTLRGKHNHRSDFVPVFLLLH